MNQLTPSTVRESALRAAHDRVTKLEAIAHAGDAWDTDLRLATTILVAEILRDVETLVTDTLFKARKRQLHRTLSRVAVSKDREKIAPVIAAFARDAKRILPGIATFDPADPPW